LPSVAAFDYACAAVSLAAHQLKGSKFVNIGCCGGIFGDRRGRARDSRHRRSHPGTRRELAERG